MGQCILVTGPARSGKSEWAEQLAAQSGKGVIYVATAQVDPSDEDWQSRIQQHQQRRPPDWQTMTVPVELAAALRTATQDECWLVDSLGTWLANLLEQSEQDWRQTVDSLLNSLVDLPGDVIFVAEETGWGVVPAYPIGRLFRDRLGTLTRQVGAIANPTYLVTAGHILNLSTLGIPVSSQLSPPDSTFRM